MYFTVSNLHQVHRFILGFHTGFFAGWEKHSLSKISLDHTHFIQTTPNVTWTALTIGAFRAWPYTESMLHVATVYVEIFKLLLISQRLNHKIKNHYNFVRMYPHLMFNNCLQ